MLNISQIDAQIKPGHTDALDWQKWHYRQVKAQGWQCQGEEMHPTACVPVFRLNGSAIWRDRSGQADWVLEAGGEQRLVSHNQLTELTANLLTPQADPFEAIENEQLRQMAADLVSDGYDQGRAIRGALLVADDKLDIQEQDASMVRAICQPSPGNHSVITGAPYYQVDYNGLGWSCDCADHQYNDVEDCKHILAARIVIERQRQRREQADDFKQAAARKMADKQERNGNDGSPAAATQEPFDSVKWALSSQQPRGMRPYAQGSGIHTYR